MKTKTKNKNQRAEGEACDQKEGRDEDDPPTTRKEGPARGLKSGDRGDVTQGRSNGLCARASWTAVLEVSDDRDFFSKIQTALSLLTDYSSERNLLRSRTIHPETLIQVRTSFGGGNARKMRGILLWQQQ